MASRPVPTATDGCSRVIGDPHPAFGHPLPEGEGLDLGRVPMASCPASDPFSLWERAGVRGHLVASRPVPTATDGCSRVIGDPHPAFGHPLPEGEGLDLGRVPMASCPASDPLSLWERAGVRGHLVASRPVPTATDGCSRVIGDPHPAFGHPLPEGEGLDLGRVPMASCPASDPLSLWERAGVRVPGPGRPLTTATNRPGEGCCGSLTRPSATLSQRERGWTRPVSRE